MAASIDTTLLKSLRGVFASVSAEQKSVKKFENFFTGGAIRLLSLW